MLYGDINKLKVVVESLRNKRKVLAKIKGNEGDIEKIRQQGIDLKLEVSAIETKLSAMEDRLESLARPLPNDTHPDAPIGDESKAKVVRVIGEKPHFNFTIKDHVDIGANLELFDFSWGSKVSGSRFVFFKNDAVFLELALVQYVMNFLRQKGFLPCLSPDMVRADYMDRVGFNPRGEGTQIYSVKNQDLCLSGTGEVPLAGMLSEQILRGDELPFKVCSFNHCFRTEVGHGGVAYRGIYRLHQFSKVEMFVYSRPEESHKTLDMLVETQAEIFEGLGLHCRILDMPTEELGASAHRKYDIEAWMPGRNEFGEVSSASNCTDYQSRRLNIRYRNNNANDFVHTLNATGVAVPRAMLAIIETHQQSDGTVRIPEVLRPYMGGKEFLDRSNLIEKKRGV